MANIDVPTNSTAIVLAGSTLTWRQESTKGPKTKAANNITTIEILFIKYSSDSNAARNTDSPPMTLNDIQFTSECTIIP
jgi:hypothetical protein